MDCVRPASYEPCCCSAPRYSPLAREEARAAERALAAAEGVLLRAPLVTHRPPFVVSQPIPALTPKVTGTVSSYSVSPALPAGLSLDPVATLSFSDPQGAPIGPTAFVNLPPGKAQTLDLSLDSLPAVQLPPGQRLEILPAVQTTRLPHGAADPVRSVCSVTSEVFKSFTNVTVTYQNAFLQSSVERANHRQVTGSSD